MSAHRGGAAVARKRRRKAGDGSGRKKARRPTESAAALERRLRPVVRRLVAEMLEDRLDYLESERSLRDGDPRPAEDVWRELGI